MSQPTGDSRASVIDSVKTPLGFLVLGLLVIEGTLASLAVTLADYRNPLVWTIIVSVFAFVLIVVALAVLQPEALRGDRPLQEVYANQFASDLFLALDGALTNLEAAERAEAWLTVADVVTSASQTDASYAKFCNVVAARLTKLANLPNRSGQVRGLASGS